MQREFGVAGTAISVVFLTAIAALALVAVWPLHPLKRLDRPVASTMRVVGRELDRASIAPQLAGWQRHVPTAAAPATGGDDPLTLASARYGEVLDMLERGQLEDEPLALAGPLRARLALVLAEQGRWIAAETALARAEAPALRAALAAGYRPNAPPASPELLAHALAAFEDPALPPAVDAWSADRLRARVLARAGDQAGAARATAAIEARGWQVWRRAALAMVPLLLSLGALLAACVWLLIRRRLEAGAAGLATAPFSLRHGLALIVRSAALGMLLAFLLLLLTKATGAEETGLGTLVFSLPLMLYLRRELAAHGLAVAPALGLRGISNGRALVLAALLLVGLEQALAVAADMGFAASGHPAHFAEVLLNDSLLFGSAPRALLFAIEAVVWAPLFEEIGFRGVLYPTLRTRLRPLPAAVLSAAVFGSVHMYSLGGSTQIFLGAVASALVYERTRSLWPCIAAHAFNNAAALAASALVYR